MSVVPLVLLMSDPASAAEVFEGHSFYLGDVHVHTGASGDGGSTDVGSCPGACGAVADLKLRARENGLDFITITDHVNGTPAAVPEDFAHVWETALDLDSPEEGFVVIPGAEVWFSLPGGQILGHRTLMLFGSSEDLSATPMTALQPLGDTRTEMPDCASIWSWSASLESAVGPLLLFPHHPATKLPSGTDWSCHDPAWAPVVEVYSEHGNSDLEVTDFDPPTTVSPAGTVAHAMAPSGLGYRLGFVGGTDSHGTDPGGVCTRDTVRTSQPYGGGLTIAVLPESTKFSRAAIYDAMVEGQTYVTSGPLIPVRVT